MDKITEVFNNIKDRFTNPLIFSFVCSWLIFNWRITIGLFWYDPEQMTNEGYASIYLFIQDQLKVKHSFVYPLLFSLGYTFLMPIIKNLIQAFYSWSSKWGTKWNLEISKGGKIGIEKYLRLRENYIKRTEELENVIAGESDFISKYQKVSSELSQLRSRHEQLQEQDSQKWEIIDNIHNLTILDGYWELKYKDPLTGGESSEQVFIDNGRYNVIGTYAKMEHVFNITNLCYNSKTKTVFFIKDLSQQEKHVEHNRVKYNINNLKFVTTDKLVGFENGKTNVEYRRKK
jgi:hypothetical protein